MSYFKLIIDTGKLSWPVIIAVIYWLSKLFGWIYREVNGKKLVVLGMMGAGKTRFYRFLQNMPYRKEDEQTEAEEYEEFEYKKKNGETIIIKKGKDISGSEDYIRTFYEDMIKDNDILIFCFDLSKYLYDNDYMKQVNCRFEFICRKYKELNRKKSNFVKLATHIDKLANPKDAIKQFNSKIEKKEYKNYFKINFFLVDVTNKESLQKVVDKIF